MDFDEIQYNIAYPIVDPNLKIVLETLPYTSHAPTQIPIKAPKKAIYKVSIFNFTLYTGIHEDPAFLVACLVKTSNEAIHQLYFRNDYSVCKKL